MGPASSACRSGDRRDGDLGPTFGAVVIFLMLELCFGLPSGIREVVVTMANWDN